MIETRKDGSKEAVGDKSCLKGFVGSIKVKNPSQPGCCTKAGVINATYVDIEMILKRGLDPVGVIGLEDPDIAEMYHQIFEVGACFPKKALWKEHRFNPFSRNFLAIDEVCVFEQWQGGGLGLDAIMATVKALSPGCCAVLLEVAPIQDRKEYFQNVFGDQVVGKIISPKFSLPGQEAYKRLIEHYGKIGFKSLPKGDSQKVFMAMGLGQPLKTET